MLKETLTLVITSGVEKIIFHNEAACHFREGGDPLCHRSSRMNWIPCFISYKLTLVDSSFVITLC